MRIPSSSLSLTLVLLLGCGSEDKEDAVSVEGTAAGDCTDGADNDADGDFDCDDEGCGGSPDCADSGSDTNAAPSGAAIAIEPAAPGDDDDLACVLITEATDPNGDAVTYRYAWSKNGTDAGLAASTVSAALTTGGDTWTCTVTPTDGTLEGAPTSATVSIAQGNRAPSAPTVSITPAAPTDDDVLTCVIGTESVDPDGDAVSYAYAWSVDGADSGITAASVNAALTEAGQQWTCSVTASDGELNSSAASVSVEVGAATCTVVTQGYLQLPELSYDLRTGWTVEYWLRVLGTPASDLLWRAWSGYDCPDLGSVGLQPEYGGAWAWAHGAPSTPRASGAVTMGTDAHIAVTFHESGTTLFVDGVPVGTGTAPGSASCAAAMLHLASGNVAVSSARLTEGLRYRAAFSPPVGVDVDTATLAAFAFEDRSTSIAADDSPHGNHATWRTAPSFADDASCR